MAFLESAVVVYLQRALGIDPRALFPLRDPAVTGDLAFIEVGREAATLAMLAAVGWLAGRSGLERLAWTAVAFGTWDILYYAWLWVFIGWPSVARNVGPALPDPRARGPGRSGRRWRSASRSSGSASRRRARLRAGRVVRVGPAQLAAGLRRRTGRDRRLLLECRSRARRRRAGRLPVARLRLRDGHRRVGCVTALRPRPPRATRTGPPEGRPPRRARPDPLSSLRRRPGTPCCRDPGRR